MRVRHILQQTLHSLLVVYERLLSTEILNAFFKVGLLSSKLLLYLWVILVVALQYWYVTPLYSEKYEKNIYTF